MKRVTSKDKRSSPLKVTDISFFQFFFTKNDVQNYSHLILSSSCYNDTHNFCTNHTKPNAPCVAKYVQTFSGTLQHLRLAL